MGRGRGRGRGKASITASPVSSAVYPSSPSVPCYETVFDGVDDYYSSNDASLKINGSQTLAFEFYLDAAGAGANRGVIGNRTSNVGGFEILKDFYLGNDRLLCYGSGSSGQSQRRVNLSGGDFDTWNKFVAVLTGTTLSGYFNGTILSVDSEKPVNVATGAFRIGSVLGFNFDMLGKLRNVEQYSGAASNPASWVPGNLTSMSGVTNVLQSADGGSTIETAQSFSTVGTPTRQECA